MNKEDILAMEAGTLLDLLIGEDVMGWENDGEWFTDKTTFPGLRLVKGFKPSTDISAAWEVVEKLKLKLQIFTYFQNEEGFEDGWCVKIDGKHVEGVETATEAICKAALLAVMDS